jgi:hypothetical protein
MTGRGINSAISGGYFEFVALRAESTFFAQVTTLYNWFLPWACLILIGTSVSKSQMRLTAVLVIMAISIMLITGDRTEPTILLLVMIIAAFLFKHSFKLWQIGLVAVLVLIILSSWDVIRTIPVLRWNQETIVTTISSEAFGISNIYSTGGLTYHTPFGWILSNVSNSYQTLMAAVRLVPNNEPFRYGSDYLKSIMISIPFSQSIGLINFQDYPNNWISSRLAPGSSVGYGFLQVGEAYINFGAFGVVGMYFILGWFLLRNWQRLVAGPVNPQLLSFSLILMNGLYTWIRNDSTIMGRTILWGAVLIYVLPGIIDRLLITKIQLDRAGLKRE